MTIHFFFTEDFKLLSYSLTILADSIKIEIK